MCVLTLWSLRRGRALRNDLGPMTRGWLRLLDDAIEHLKEVTPSLGIGGTRSSSVLIYRAEHHIRSGFVQNGD